MRARVDTCGGFVCPNGQRLRSVGRVLEFRWTRATAVVAFFDPFADERFDDWRNYGEERINMLAMCRGTVIHVTYAERENRVRIVSTRRAEKHEQDDYYRENTV
ncbi:MAG: BrnT family toxin [Bryobacteraceae bacterium]